MKYLVLILVFCLGCAMGHVHMNNGTEVSALAFGQSRVEVCEQGPLSNAEGEHSSADGAHLNCIKVEGGSLSMALSGIIGALTTAAVAYFSGGMF